MSELPEPMIPISGRPMLRQIVKWFARWIFSDFAWVSGTVQVRSSSTT